MEGHANASEIQERMAESNREQEAAEAGYSSAEQARAATELAQMWQAHKKIDTELAGRAKAMLKEMVSSGGDIDIAAVQGLLSEAQRRYESADRDVVQKEATMDGAPDGTTFFKVEPKEAGKETHAAPSAGEASRTRTKIGTRVEASTPRETAAQQDAKMWEGWRTHLRSMDVVSEDGMDVNLASAQKLGLSAEQANHIAALQRAEYMRGASKGSEVGARVVTRSSRETGGMSQERQQLQQQRDAATLARDALMQKLRTAAAHERGAVQRQLHAADAHLAQVEAAMRAAG